MACSILHVNKNWMNVKKDCVQRDCEKCLSAPNHFNCFNSYVSYFVWLLTAQTGPRPAPSLACPVWDQEKWPIMSSMQSEPEICWSNKPLSRYRKNSIAFILCHFSQPVHDCSLTQFWFCFSFLFSLTHLWSSFICSLLVWSKTIGLSSLPPSQSSVDHKEFKRCGPFDPYINAKVCTHSAAETTFLLKYLFAFLLCRLCCAWVWFAAAACRGRSAAELRGGFSVDSCSLAFCSCLLVIFSLIQMLCLT